MFRNLVHHLVGLDNVVGIVTRYGLDGLGSNASQGRISHTYPYQSWGPPSLLHIGYWLIPRGKQLGYGIYHPLPSSTDI